MPVGECWIDPLPIGLPASAPIQVRCGILDNGLIEVIALDMTSGTIARTELVRKSGLSEEDLAKEAAFVRGLDIQ
jgi:molecular chaperone DnaK